MLATILLASIVVGAFGSSTLLIVGLPLWVALLAYPVFGTLGLFSVAAFLAGDRTGRENRSRADAVPVAARQPSKPL